MKRTLLIDADIVAYKFAFTSEGVFYFDGKDKPPAVEADLEDAKKRADEYLRDLKVHLGATDMIICLTDRGQEFRRDFWPAYKENRKGTRKPENLFPLLDHFAATNRSYLKPRLEADDCMGILATHPTLVTGEKIIVSEDKDMKTIPGLLFNPRKDEVPRKIGKIAADRYHLEQTITGDQTDNYPGCPGVGEKSPEVAAVRLMKTVEEGWRHVVAAYERKGLTAADALIQARCARILRASDWDFKDKRPRLWTPPVSWVG
jgi:DNA polymerase-1